MQISPFLVAAAIAFLTACTTPPLPCAGTGCVDGALPLADLAIADTTAGPLKDLQVACPDVFPVFDKHCATAADCFIALHMPNCCGYDALGLNVSATSDFAAAEKICETMYPACGCAAPTKAEDGRTEVQGMIAVRCSSSVCNTYVP